jgi:predicted NUDIX family NTP pyrophosphohydrolase
VAKLSAGVLVHRQISGAVEVLLVHPGGPFWRSKDVGAWSIPKGEHDENEDPEAAARREFSEETGWVLAGDLVSLGAVRQSGGKTVTAFAVEGDFDVSTLRSNTFELEWPPRSGRKQAFAEVDRAAWYGLAEASRKIIVGQRPFLERLPRM